jgi:cephalosporin hydroxylase
MIARDDSQNQASQTLGEIRRLYQAKRASEALRLLDAIPSSDPADLEVLELRFLSLMDVGQFEKAMDVVAVKNVSHENVTFAGGDGRNLGATLTPEVLSRFERPWLVIEDADHSYETSLAVLDFFHPLLRPGEYIVVEDGIISDLYPESFPDYSSGPHRALREFLARHEREYAIDAQYCDFFGYNATWSSNGFLKRIA